MQLSLLSSSGSCFRWQVSFSTTACFELVGHHYPQFQKHQTLPIAQVLGGHILPLKIPDSPEIVYAVYKADHALGMFTDVQQPLALLSSFWDTSTPHFAEGAGSVDLMTMFLKI